MINAKERLVLNEVFSLIIRMDWRIKFVGMVVQNGKLIAGQTRRILFSMTDKPTDTARNTTHIYNSKIDDQIEIFFRCKNMYLFYSNYLMWVIESCTVHLEDHESINETSPYFEISGYNNDEVKLAVTPLNISTETFLCIYFEPAYNIRNADNDSEEGFEGLLNRINSNVL